MPENVINILKRVHSIVIIFFILLQFFSIYMKHIKKEKSKIYDFALEQTPTIVLTLGVLYYSFIDDLKIVFLVTFILLVTSNILKEISLRRELKRNDKELDCVMDTVSRDIEILKKITPMPFNAYSISDLHNKENKKGLKISVRDNEYIVVMCGDEPVRIFNEFNRKTIRILNSMGYIIVYHGRD